MLAAFGIHEELHDLNRFVGPPMRGNFKSCGISEQDMEIAVVKYREYYAEKGIFENAVYPGIAELLQNLANKGKTLAVATNKYALYAEQSLEHFDICKYFSLVSGDDKDGTLSLGGKSEIIRIALDALDPQRNMTTVMIGDRDQDILGAKANGIDSIGLTWGYGSRAELEEAAPTWIVDTPEELYNLIVG